MRLVHVFMALVCPRPATYFPVAPPSDNDRPWKFYPLNNHLLAEVQPHFLKIGWLTEEGRRDKLHIKRQTDSRSVEVLTKSKILRSSRVSSTMCWGTFDEADVVPLSKGRSTLAPSNLELRLTTTS